MGEGADARTRAEALLKRVLNAEQLAVDDFGNWPIRWGSALFYVRVIEPPMSPPIVQVFSPVLGSVEKSPELLDAINDINAQTYFARVAWINGVVAAATDLLAETLDLQELQAACATIAHVADAHDDALQARFGGQVAFPDQAGVRMTDHHEPSGTPRGLSEEEAKRELQKSLNSSKMVQNILFGA